MNAKLVIALVAVALLVAVPLATAKADMAEGLKEKKNADAGAPEGKGKPALTGLLNALQHVPDHVKGILQAILDGTHKGAKGGA